MILLSTGLRQAMLDNIGFRSAFANGCLFLYTGAQPASADSAKSGTLAVKITLAGGIFNFDDPTNGLNFDSPINGVINKAAAEIWSGLGLVNDTIGWYRMCGNQNDDFGPSTYLCRMDGSVGVGGADLNLGTVGCKVNAPCTIDTFQWTMPAG
jgi:hypothetical protein